MTLLFEATNWLSRAYMTPLPALTGSKSMRSLPGSFMDSYQVCTSHLPVGSSRDVFCLKARVLYHFPVYRRCMAAMTESPLAKRGAGGAGAGAGMTGAGARPPQAVRAARMASGRTASRAPERVRVDEKGIPKASRRVSRTQPGQPRFAGQSARPDARSFDERSAFLLSFPQ